MIDVTVKLPDGEISKLRRFLHPDKMSFAESQALNRTRANVNKLALKLVAEDMGIPLSKLAKRARARTVSRDNNSPSGKFGGVGPGRKATRRRLTTSVIGRGRPFNVARWKAKEVRSGASVSLKGRNKKGSGTVLGTLHSAYGREQFAKKAWRLKNGAVVVRHGASFRGVYGPGVGQVMEKREIVRKLVMETQKRFDQHFTSAIRFAFAGGVR